MPEDVRHEPTFSDCHSTKIDFDKKWKAIFQILSLSPIGITGLTDIELGPIHLIVKTFRTYL